MKRKVKEVEKRTYKLKGAFPTFVSLVDRGANFTPLKELRFSENEKFSQDVEINRIEFSKNVFKDQAAVEAYLAENDYQEYSVIDSGETFSVLGVESDKFQEVQPLELEEGVLYFVGKLKEEDNSSHEDAEQEQPPAIVVESEEFSDAKPEAEATTEVVEEEKEIVAESDSENKEVSNEQEQEPTEETSTAPEDASFSEEEIKEEVLTEVNTSDKFAELEAKLEKFQELENKIKELEEKLAKFTEKQEDTIDENEIIIQNSHSVHSDEIVIEQEKSIDETSQKFSEKRRNDLFGLRG